MPDEIERAGAALDRGDYAAALDLLDRADASASPTELLEMMARAAYGAGEFERSVQAWEDLHRHHLADGDQVGAATASAMVAMYLMMDTGLMATVRGWLRTTERLLDGLEGTPAHALMAMTRTYERFMCGDMEAARRQAELAIDIGTRTDVTPAVVIGRVAAARITIFEGDLQRGLAEL